MPPKPEHVIVGRVRKAHGIRGEVVVEPLTNDPATVFATGHRLLSEAHGELHIRRSTPFKGGWILRLAEITTRNEAELWRERYLLVPTAELEPLADDEVYYHDLVGLNVQLAGGEPVGRVEALYEVPQGLMLDVRTERGTVMIPYRPEVITQVDVEHGTIVIDPPAGLFD